MKAAGTDLYAGIAELFMRAPAEDLLEKMVASGSPTLRVVAVNRLRLVALNRNRNSDCFDEFFEFFRAIHVEPGALDILRGELQKLELAFDTCAPVIHGRLGFGVVRNTGPTGEVTVYFPATRRTVEMWPFSVRAVEAQDRVLLTLMTRIEGAGVKKA